MGWLARGRTARSTSARVVALGAYLTRLYGPLTALSNVNVSIMTALVSFERVFEVLDLPPMIADAPDAVDLPAGANVIEFDHVEFRYPAAADVSLASLESVAILDTLAEHAGACTTSRSARRAGATRCASGAVGRRQDDDLALVSRLYDVTGGDVRINGIDVRARDAVVVTRSGRRGHPRQPHVPRHHPGESALREARRDRG